MHILLTDILSCPRCGPAFGLILLADRTERRRVSEGRLGCANCRESYPVLRGKAHFGELPAGVDVDEVPAEWTDPERLAALLGLEDAVGAVLLGGAAAAAATSVSALAPDAEIVALGVPDETAPAADAAVTRIVAGARLPFASGRLNGAAIVGSAAQVWLDDALAAVAPARRILSYPAPADASARLTAAGYQILAQQDGGIVAVRSGRPLIR